MVIMKDRLIEFMKIEGFTSVKFAEIMEVQPSSISHILSGRNNPNFDFISKFLKRFPDINPDWIINGEGAIYKGNPSATGLKITKVNQDVITNVKSNKPNLENSNLFQQSDNNYQINNNNTDSYAQDDSMLSDSLNSVNATYSAVEDIQPSNDPSERENIKPDPFLKPSANDLDERENKSSSMVHNSFTARARTIKRIILLYDDDSYDILDK